MHDRTAGLRAAAEHATVFLATLDERPVAARADAAAVRSSLGGPLPELGEDPATVIDALAAGAEPNSIEIVELTELPMTHMRTTAVQVKVRAVGKLRVGGA